MISISPASGFDKPSPDTPCAACGQPVGNNPVLVGHTDLDEVNILCSPCAEFGKELIARQSILGLLGGPSTPVPEGNRAARRSAMRMSRRRG